MTCAVQNMLTLLKWLAGACKECPRRDTSHCAMCASCDAGHILEQYNAEIKTGADGSRISDEKARFLTVLVTLYKVEAKRIEVSRATKCAVNSRKVCHDYLHDLVRRGYLELSESGDTVTLTPLGLEFARMNAKIESQFVIQGKNHE